MGILLLTTTSFGLYNSDAVEDFRIFSKRFLIVWQLLLIPAGLTFVLTKIASGHPLGWQSLAFAAAVAAFVAVLFALHRLIAWGMGLSFMKTRILVLGSGPSVEALSGFLTGPGRSHFLHVDTVGDWRQEDDTPPPVGHNVPALPSSEPGALLKFAQMLKTDEIVVAGITSPVNAVLSATRACSVTLDDDDGPTVRFDPSDGDQTINEGSGGGFSDHNYDVILSTNSVQTVSVAFVVSGDANDADRTVLTASPLTFAPGVSRRSITIRVFRDNSNENDNDVVLTLTSATDATVGAPTVRTHTINNDD